MDHRKWTLCDDDDDDSNKDNSDWSSMMTMLNDFDNRINKVESSTDHHF